MLVENKTTEFKREYVDDIKKTIIAFANCDGGTLMIGVDDDGTVCGISDIDGTMQRVTNTIRDAVRPDITMFTECRDSVLDGRPVLCVTVQRGTARPYYLQGKGIRPEGVYVRQGASTVPATEAAILSMIKETSGDSYEAARSLNQQLTFCQTSALFQKRNIDFGNAQMRTLRLIGEDGTFTNLAFLLSDQCTHTVKLALFDGSRKTVFRDRMELSGSLLSQLEDAFAYIDRHNRTRSEFSGLDRIDMRDYPPEAIREALLNALVHRDYSFSSPTLISIFDDRIEFVTIGGLIRGISMEDIRLGISVLRNQNLAGVFYRLRLIEAYGTGILKINENYDGFPIKPVMEATANAFKIVLPNTNYQKTAYEKSVYSQEKHQSFGEETHYTAPARDPVKEERINTVIELCRKNGYIMRTDIQRALNISQATAILLLRELTASGLLITQGAARNLRYYLNEP